MRVDDCVSSDGHITADFLQMNVLRSFLLSIYDNDAPRCTPRILRITQNTNGNRKLNTADVTYVVGRRKRESIADKEPVAVAVYN